MTQREQHRSGVAITTTSTTFAELGKLWLERALPTGTVDTTRSNYESLVRTHLRGPLGHRKVADLRLEDFDTVLDAMAEAGYSGRTMRLTLDIARRILRFGERRGVLARNVAAVVQAPRGPTHERHGLSSGQASALLSAGAEDRLGPLITVSLLLGLRPGEAAGLTWDAVRLDTEQPIVRVEGSLRRTSAGMILVSPKTRTSRPTLALPEAAAEALRQQRQRQQEDRRAAGERWANDLNLVSPQR